jgi:plastocyanin
MSLSTACHAIIRPTAVAAGLGALLGLGIAAPLAAQQGARISIADSSFAPSRVTVAKGGTVTWVNTDSTPHSVVVTGKPLKTPTLQKGKSARLKFAQSGRFDYVCGIHPSMSGTVEVR